VRKPVMALPTSRRGSRLDRASSKARVAALKVGVADDLQDAGHLVLQEA
jgi:hypothetical protein